MFENLPEAVEFVLSPPWQNDVRSIADQVTPKSDRPFVISIGGNSRGGKSTLAELLRRELEHRGLRALRISLDDWLTPRSERTPDMGVLDRFRVGDIERDVGALLSGRTISRGWYDPRTGATRDDAVEYRASDVDVVILDGVVALGTEKLRVLADIRVFVDVPLETWRARGIAFFEWKGHDSAQIASILEVRRADEFNVVATHAQWARAVVTQPQ